MDDILYRRIPREGRFVMASFVFFSLYKYTYIRFYRITCISNAVVVTLGLFVSLKRKVWNFFRWIVIFFFFYVYVYGINKRCFHRGSIAINANNIYIYIIARTNKNNYVLLMIVHNPMDPLINDPSLLHD